MFFNYKNEMKLHYEIHGKGTPILIIHGLGCDMRLMKECIEPAFDDCLEYKRIYVDLPGMGFSTANGQFASSDRILEVLLAFIEFAIPTSFLLIGESFGGYLSQGIVSSINTRVLGLFLLCPVVFPAHDDRAIPKNIKKYYDNNFLDSLTDEELTNFTYCGVICNEDTYVRYKRSILPGLRIGNTAFIDKLSLNYSFSKKLDLVLFEKPVTILCGKQDNVVGFVDQFSLMSQLLYSEYVVLDKAGHNLQIEHPAQVENIVKNWIKRTEA